MLQKPAIHKIKRSISTPLLSRYHLYAACPPRRRSHNPSLGAREVSPPAAATAVSPCEAALAAASARATRNDLKQNSRPHLFFTTRLSPITLARICPPQPTPTARLATAAHACRLATASVPWEGVGCSCGLDSHIAVGTFCFAFPPQIWEGRFPRRVEPDHTRPHLPAAADANRALGDGGACLPPCNHARALGGR